MATLAQLKARVITETNRDDLSGDLSTWFGEAIAQAVEFYQGERFWFNQGTATATTTPATATISVPATLRLVDSISYNGELLDKTSLGSIAHSTDTGTPTMWADDGDSIWLYPIPDAAYSLTFVGIASVAAPSDDADSNIWTNQAYDLIASYLRFLLCRDVLADNEGAQRANGAVGDALGKLRIETMRRRVSHLRSDVPTARGGFNINRGW